MLRAITHAGGNVPEPRRIGGHHDDANDEPAGEFVLEVTRVRDADGNDVHERVEETFTLRPRSVVNYGRLTMLGDAQNQGTGVLHDVVCETVWGHDRAARLRELLTSPDYALPASVFSDVIAYVGEVYADRPTRSRGR